MDRKIQELTEKLYNEGVKKGEEEKQSIINTAKQEADKIVSEARTEAGMISAAAAKQAEEMKWNTESEIKLSTQQVLSSLKQQITDLVILKVIKEPVTKVLSDPVVIKDFISQVIAKWKDSDSHNEMSLEVLLPESKRKELDELLRDSLADILKKDVSVNFSKTVKNGFQIKSKQDSFKISMTDEDFISFFKEYLRPRIRKLLFNE